MNHVPKHEQFQVHLDPTMVQNRQFDSSEQPIRQFLKSQPLTIAVQDDYGSRFETADYGLK